MRAVLVKLGPLFIGILGPELSQRKRPIDLLGSE